MDPFALGVEVKKISKTQEGHLLFEVKGGPNATADAATLSNAVSAKVRDITGPVAHLGITMNMEINDLDSSALEEDVLSALAKAVARVNDVEAAFVRDQIMRCLAG